MKSPFLKSIRVALLLLIFIAVLPALGIIINSNIERQANDIETAKSDALIMLHGLANDHESVIEVTRRFLMTLAKLPAIQNRDVSACNKLFRELIKENTQYTAIYAADIEGTIFANSLPSSSINIKHRKYFQEAVGAKKFSVEQFVIGPVSRRAVLPFAYPVTDAKGKVTGVIAISLDLEKYGQFFIATTRFPKDSTLNLLDRNFIRLYRHPDHEKYVGKLELPEIVMQLSAAPLEGVFTSAGVDGVRRLYAYKKFFLKDDSLPYLYMRVGIPEAQIFAHTRKTFIRNVGLLIGSLLAAMLIAWFIGNALIVKRIHKLVDASRHVGRGDLTVRTGLDHDGGELGRLAHSFDEMAAALETTEKERNQVQQRLIESEVRYRTTTELSNDGMVIVREGRYVYVNQKFVKLFGYDSPDEILGKTFALAVHPDDLDMVTDYYRKRQNNEPAPSTYDFKAIRKNGDSFYIDISVARAEYNGESVTIASFRDATERRHLEEKLRSMSIMDELTGLYNRRGFFTLALQQLRIADRTGKACLLFFIDLDDLKWINDTLGHQEGDNAIIETALILKKTFRVTDIIARMGGDEFAILAIETDDKARDLLTRRLHKFLNDNNGAKERNFTLSMSIGVADYDSKKSPPLDELLTQADISMYEEKRKKKGESS